MDHRNEYTKSLTVMNNEMLRTECLRLYDERQALSKTLLSEPAPEKDQPDSEHWTCPVCDRSWGKFAYQCANCGFRLGAYRFIAFESIYVAQPGTPVVIGEGSDHEYKTVIRAHCVIDNILHYVVWYPAGAGHSYRLVSGGMITPLDVEGK